ncbi:N-acetylglucosamine kinase [Brevibacillus borstelensis]|uniref:N-acetylglucosamine kinase n=1 Tax=Brevibacillus borstelensis TaxID=45462 RepID=UPI0030BD479A
MQVNKTRRLFIGIDGGGSKTNAAICDETGEIVGRAVGEGTNPLSRPWPQVEDTIRRLVDELIVQAGGWADDVEAIFLGLAGADRPEVKGRIEDAFGPAWGGRLQIDNDAAGALYSGTWGEPGIVLIAGTGSIAYALTDTGARHRVGGWGYLLGDEGSGYDLGRQAVIAVLRAFDGRGAPTLLSELVIRHFEVDRPDQLIARLYSSPNPRKDLAEVSVLAERAAEAGDEAAARCVNQAARSLLELAEACRSQTSDSMPVVLAGGLLAADTMLRRQLLELARFDVIIPRAAPVSGCLAAALLRAGLKMDEKMKTRLAGKQTNGAEEDAHG